MALDKTVGGKIETLIAITTYPQNNIQSKQVRVCTKSFKMKYILPGKKQYILLYTFAECKTLSKFSSEIRFSCRGISSELELKCKKTLITHCTIIA